MGNVSFFFLALYDVIFLLEYSTIRMHPVGSRSRLMGRGLNLDTMFLDFLDGFFPNY